MIEYKEHRIICIIQSDEANKAWVEFSQLVMDNPQFQINRDAFDSVLNNILATRVNDVEAMDEAIAQIHKGATQPLSEDAVNWIVDAIDNIAVAIKRAIPVLSETQKGLVTKCELVNRTRRNFTLNVTILEPVKTKENWEVTHFI